MHLLLRRKPSTSPLFPYTTLFRSARFVLLASGSREQTLPGLEIDGEVVLTSREALERPLLPASVVIVGGGAVGVDRKSTRLNSSHRCTSYAVFSLKKKKARGKVNK